MAKQNSATNKPEKAPGSQKAASPAKKSGNKPPKAADSATGPKKPAQPAPAKAASSGKKTVHAGKTAEAPAKTAAPAKAAAPSQPAAAPSKAAAAKGPSQASFTPPSFGAAAHLASARVAPEASPAEALEFSREEVLKAWWQAARPPFYIATLIPLFLGFLAAGSDTGVYNWLVFAGALLVCLALHLSSNLGNDLFDHLQGTDTEESIGGSRVLQQGKITVPELRRATMACYVAAFVLMVVGVVVTGHIGLIPIVLFGMFSSYFYVAPPIRYGYHALGELFVFLNMGIVMVGGTYYAITGHLPSHIIALSLPVGLMVAGILYFQSLPEIESDKAMGKHTLAGILGPEKAIFLFKLWWPGIWSVLFVLYLSNVCAWPVLLGIAICIPVHVKACRRVDSVNGDWFSLDQHGKLVRLMYLICGLFMIFGVLAK